jgi:hypothetical protein
MVTKLANLIPESRTRKCTPSAVSLRKSCAAGAGTNAALAHVQRAVYTATSAIHADLRKDLDSALALAIAIGHQRAC